MVVGAKADRRIMFPPSVTEGNAITMEYIVSAKQIIKRNLQPGTVLVIQKRFRLLDLLVYVLHILCSGLRSLKFYCISQIPIDTY